MKWQPLILKTLLLFLMSSAFMASCTKSNSAAAPAVKLPDTPSFKNNIQPIFNTTCAISGCHVSPSPASGLDLDSAVAYKDLLKLNLINTALPSQSNLYLALNTGMPPSGRNASLNALVLKWIQQGAKNN